MKYAITGPNGRALLTVDSWTEAVEKSVDLSIRFEFRFRVGATQQRLPFMKERLQILDAADRYVEQARLDPNSQETRLAKLNLRRKIRNLVMLDSVMAEPRQEHFLTEAYAKSHFPAATSY